MKILIVEHEKTVPETKGEKDRQKHHKDAITSLKKLLNKTGYEVITVFNSAEGLEVLKLLPSCRIVISDWEEPFQDAINFCKEVRVQEQQKYIYFIFFIHLFGDQTGTDWWEAVSAGADDFMYSYSPDEIIARLRIGERMLAKPQESNTEHTS